MPNKLANHDGDHERQENYFTNDKLIDIVTRLDERIKNIQSDQNRLDKKIDDNARKIDGNANKINEYSQKISVIDNNMDVIKEIDEKLNDHNKRLLKIEEDQGRNSDRWRTIGGFLIQLIWVILAAYLLTKLNLQSPTIP